VLANFANAPDVMCNFRRDHYSSGFEKNHYFSLITICKLFFAGQFGLDKFLEKRNLRVKNLVGERRPKKISSADKQIIEISIFIGQENIFIFRVRQTFGGGFFWCEKFFLTQR
jgi:hypothetical protein